MRRPRSVSPLRAIVLIAAHHEDARELFGSVPTDSRLWPLCASASGSLACEHSAEAALLSFVQAREKRRRRRGMSPTFEGQFLVDSLAISPRPTPASTSKGRFDLPELQIVRVTGLHMGGLSRHGEPKPNQ
ncbi:hypothetical protein TgHK011_001401 [Trichoderma gracile]|nr:hypothetical protein TgHK011_001401 [Trichoderma gracile]